MSYLKRDCDPSNSNILRLNALQVETCPTYNQVERLAKEIKRRIKVIEVFPDKGSVETLLHLILKELNDGLNSRRLRGFKEIELVNYHALPEEIFTQ
jgi:transposase-like protein